MMTERRQAGDIQGTILEIIRMSTEDGPGIRTTLFFKGCTLRCSWCHNPESIKSEPEVQWTGSNCIGCGMCVQACPHNAIKRIEECNTIDRSLCTVCGICAEQCPALAMELLGKRWSVQGLADELVKDRSYFVQSGGGVTLSGGEAAMQKEFSLGLLKELSARGIHTALDTCGHVSRSALGSLLPFVDILLYDIKEMDPLKHRTFTGAGNEAILENAVFAADFMRNHIRPKTLWIRTPVIPGATATHENIRGIGAFIEARLHGAVERWELCAFNNLCRDKYKRLGIDWQFASGDLMSRELMEELARTARGSGVDPSIVRWTGTTSLRPDSGGASASGN